MEKLEILIRDTSKALATFKEITRTPYSIIVRDAAIQRFEYSFEISWKLIKEFLKQQEGIICNSPKSCFRDAFRMKLLSEEEAITALEMTDDRNLTSHTYHEELAEEIYGKIGGYYNLMENIYKRINERIISENDIDEANQKVNADQGSENDE